LAAFYQFGSQPGKWKSGLKLIMKDNVIYKNEIVICVAAIGLDEGSRSGHGFLAEVCVDWEREAMVAEQLRDCDPSYGSHFHNRVQAVGIARPGAERRWNTRPTCGNSARSFGPDRGSDAGDAAALSNRPRRNDGIGDPLVRARRPR